MSTRGLPTAPRVRGPRLPEHTLWINGELKRGEDALVSLFDRGARDGEGLFETLRVDGGQPRAWDRHMERLVLSAAVLGFPVPPSPSRLRHGIAQVLAADGLSDAVVRITVTRGIPGGRPTRTGAWIEAEALASRLWAGARHENAAAVVSRMPFQPGPLGPHKTTSRLAYALAREEARAARVDEALLASADGEVFEGAASNLFVVKDGAVRTPSLDRGILPGVTRALVLACGEALGMEVREARLTREDLAMADEVFLTNAVQEVVPLTRLDGRLLASRATGDRLRAALRERFRA